MKSLTSKIAIYSILSTILFFSCKTEERIPPPELTYSGTETIIQNPLSPEESQLHIQLPKGFTAELFAAEPNIINPIAFTWDERGRLWVVQSMDYPHKLEDDVGGDRITICEDTDGDGKADKFTDFASSQSLSTGITIVKGGAIVAQAPEMVFLEDTNGDDVMDKRTVLFDGFGTWDTHAGPSNLKYGLDNQIWGAVGYSGFQQTFGGNDVDFSMGVYRFARDGSSFEPMGKFNNNTWGLGITEDFEIFGSTANNNHACYVGIPLRHYDYLGERPSWAINADFIQGHYEITAVDTVPLQQVDVRGGYTAAAGANFYTATNYPAKYRGQMYVNAPTGHLVHLARMVEDGAGYQEEDGGNIFASTDAWTAPVHTETGPDGNLWVADWYNPVIQHNPDKRGMPNQIWNNDKGPGNAHLNEHRDLRHGRIYVIKYKGKVDNSIASLNPEDQEGLISGLKSSNMFWRQTAQRLIVENNLTGLTSKLLEMAKANDVTAMHALWTLDGIGAFENIDSDALALIKKSLSSSAEVVKRTGLSLLPTSEDGSELLVSSGLLTAKNLFTRKQAILKASDLPETASLYQALESERYSGINGEDKWLRAAFNIYFREQNNETVDEDDVSMVIPSNDEEITSWAYTTDDPGDNWMATDFDDSSWENGESVFGSKDFPATRTTWSTEDIWLRKTVTINKRLKSPVLKVLHDEDYEVYVNGELFRKDKGWGGEYKFIRIDDKSRLFKNGENTIAVKCHNENGRQFIDIGIGDVAQFEADRTITLNTVNQVMEYEDTILYATAGEKLEITLNNVDQMQHNLVLIEKGSLAAFGKMVDKFVSTEEAADLEYVPQSRYVLAASSMLDPGEKGSIQLTLPNEPGDYPFVCTFPGHWQMMQGVLKVSPKGTYVSTNPSSTKIVNMAGGSSHDFLRYFGEADGKILHQNGRNSVYYTENPAEMTAMLPDADVLMISNNKAFDEPAKKAIFNHVRKGGDMLIYHPSAWYNWKAWPEYNRQLVGGGSRSHEPLQEFEVIVRKPNHPIMKNVPSTFRITDELYRYEKDPRGIPIEVLAVGRGLESGATFPVVWLVKHPKAKIVCNTLGHDNDAHGLEAYQTILDNSIEYLKAKRLNI